jgi:serine/threonine-protein kinase
MACGKLPFEGDSMAQLMFRIANEPHTDILSIKADLPACLVAIINRSLAKQIEDRYANGAEMADALRQCAALVRMGTPVSAPPRSGDPSAASI